MRIATRTTKVHGPEGPRFYVAKLEGHHIADGYGARGGNYGPRVYLTVHDRLYGHEAIWQSGPLTRDRVGSASKLAKTIAAELNDGGLSPATERRLRQIEARPAINARVRAHTRALRLRETKAADAKAERRLNAEVGGLRRLPSLVGAPFGPRGAGPQHARGPGAGSSPETRPFADSRAQFGPNPNLRPPFCPNSSENRPDIGGNSGGIQRKFTP